MEKERRSLVRLVAQRLLFIIIGLAAAEIVLRLIGFTPWQLEVRAELRDVVTEFHPVLGWKNKAGQAFFRGREIKVTNWERGERASAPAPIDREKNLFLFDDSVLFGYGISDEETLGWKLQEKYPDIRIHTIASPGYSTLQSLLSLEEPAKEKELKNALVILGVADYSEERNVASSSWVELLTLRTSRLTIPIPYGDLKDDGTLAIHPTEDYWLNLPLRTHVAIVRLIEEAYAGLAAMKRLRHEEEISLAIIDEFVRQVRSRSGKPLIFMSIPFANPSKKERYEAFLKAHDIPFLSCVHPHTGEPGFTVPGDNHPNGVVHAYWAECLTPLIQGAFTNAGR